MTERTSDIQELSQQPSLVLEHQQFEERKKDLQYLQRLICIRVAALMPDSPLDEQKTAAKKTLKTILENREHIKDAVDSNLIDLYLLGAN